MTIELQNVKVVSEEYPEKPDEFPDNSPPHHLDEKKEAERDRGLSIEIPELIPKKLQIVEYEGEQVYILDKRFQRLHRDSVKLLSKSKRYSKTSMFIKIIIIICSLSTSYLSAVSGTNELTKTYLITSLSLLSALISGVTSVKNFSSEASRLYTGYVEYQEKCSVIEQIFYHFQGTVSYDELILSIDNLLSKYEKDIDKSEKQMVANVEKRLVYLQEVMEGHLRSTTSDNTLPLWYTNKIKIEDHTDRYNIEHIKRKKQEQRELKTISMVTSQNKPSLWKRIKLLFSKK
jgi:hypothetical protein